MLERLRYMGLTMRLEVERVKGINGLSSSQSDTLQVTWLDSGKDKGSKLPKMLIGIQLVSDWSSVNKYCAKGGLGSDKSPNRVLY